MIANVMFFLYVTSFTLPKHSIRQLLSLFHFTDKKSDAYSFIKYMLSAYHKPGTILVTGDMAVNKQGQRPLPSRISHFAEIILDPTYYTPGLFLNNFTYQHINSFNKYTTYDGDIIINIFILQIRKLRHIEGKSPAQGCISY